MDVATKKNCPACEHTEISQSFQVLDHEYGLKNIATYDQCGNCKTLFQFPMPTLEELSEYYPDNYHSYDTENVLQKIRNKMRLNRLKAITSMESITVLDYGCGDGTFLKQASLIFTSSKFIGYEYASTYSVQQPTDKVTLYFGSFDEFIEVLPKCDIILMNHVVEHLPNPCNALERLFCKLNKNGLFEGQTPAANSFELDLFKESWAGFHAPRHTVVFSRLGLVTLFERLNMGKIKIEKAFNPAGIAISLISRTHKGQPGVIQRKGFKWLFFIVLGSLLSIFDMMSGRSGIMNFSCRK